MCIECSLCATVLTLLYVILPKPYYSQMKKLTLKILSNLPEVTLSHVFLCSGYILSSGNTLCNVSRNK